MTKKILIIDDDPEIVELAKSRLVANHYQVVTTFSGAEGLKQVELEKPDLILVDIKMPQVEGYTFVRELKKTELGRNIPVIVCTAYAHMKDLFAVEGIADYIVKPFKDEDFVAAVKRHLKQ